MDVAIDEVYELDACVGDLPVVSQPVIGLPESFSTPSQFAIVNGRPEPGHVVTVGIEEPVLRPAGTCGRGLGPPWIDAAY